MSGGFAPVMTAPALTLAEKRQQVLDVLKDDTKSYNTLRETEYADPRVFRERSTAGTILAPIVQARGLEPNHGAVMDDLELTQGDLHALCNCHHGLADGVTGKQAEVLLRGVFNGHTSHGDH